MRKRNYFLIFFDGIIKRIIASDDEMIREV